MEEEPKYMILNPLCSVIDERNVWQKTHEPYIDFSNHIRWKKVNYILVFI